MPIMSSDISIEISNYKNIPSSIPPLNFPSSNSSKNQRMSFTPGLNSSLFLTKNAGIGERKSYSGALPFKESMKIDFSSTSDVAFVYTTKIRIMNVKTVELYCIDSHAAACANFLKKLFPDECKHFTFTFAYLIMDYK